ncbi:DUF2235 domain-containing protein [Paracoccus siganidrum]|uniref:DUF2235 domain-containing protein n=1 Tax=Paracoccus siganidrum TaxID=1276757 RepID=A0A419A5N0_9RHOB|nr:DUF2235 domain-containing protein [Paracoccus siganidrum]RJL11673.1 DUF2235 domain-containing protein [Paracoccus siganidrum]RMC41188.1 DUF2235 domain-containing protein [Paracoccus siganidrum]
MQTIRPTLIHVVLIDGTFASLADGRHSSIGRIHDLLRGQMGPLPGARLRLYYAAGQQWNRWQTLPELAMGRALERRIIEAYGWLANGWRPGDPVFLFGYSRGAFAVRSLAGMIGRIGLLRPERATERNTRLAWRLYREGGTAQTLAAFRRRCHPDMPIRAICCFDTVAALGLRLPLLWMVTEPMFRFHDAHLGAGVQHGFHALALDETRAAYAPLLWDANGDADAGGHADGRVRQMWFRGVHPDIGGQLRGLEFARPLANIPLVWMLEQAGGVGLPLPEDWRRHFPCDATAPSIGSWRQWGKAFLARAPRLAGANASEDLHPTVPRPYPGPALLAGQLADQAADRPRRRLSRKALPEAEPPRRKAQG